MLILTPHLLYMDSSEQYGIVVCVRDGASYLNFFYNVSNGILILFKHLCLTTIHSA
jgi:hypothetical protein